MALAGSDPDLEGGVIAVQVNTIQAGHVAESGATPVEFATPDETIAAVRHCEADAVFADKDYLAPIVEQSGGVRRRGCWAAALASACARAARS